MFLCISELFVRPCKKITFVHPVKPPVSLPSALRNVFTISGHSLNVALKYYKS